MVHSRFDLLEDVRDDRGVRSMDSDSIKIALKGDGVSMVKVFDAVSGRPFPRPDSVTWTQKPGESANLVVKFRSPSFVTMRVGPDVELKAVAETGDVTESTPIRLCVLQNGLTGFDGLIFDRASGRQLSIATKFSINYELTPENAPEVTLELLAFDVTVDIGPHNSPPRKNK